MKRLYLLLFCLLPLLNCQAAEPDEDYVYQLLMTPQGWDNRAFAVCWFNEKTIYNIRSFPFVSLNKITDVRVSPALSTFAALHTGGRTPVVTLFNFNDGSQKRVIRSSEAATAVAYSSNAKHLSIAYETRCIRMYNLSDYSLWKTIPTSFVPQKLYISPNEYYVASADEQMLYVWNIETGKMRKLIELDQAVNHVAFSPNSDRMAVLTANGVMRLYDTKTFEITDTFTSLNEARECIFHPEGKYMAVITAADQITVLNLKNQREERRYINPVNGSVLHLGFVRKLSGDIYLVYNTGARLIFHPLNDLIPDYQRLVAQEVDDMMDEWMKQMPGESLEEYHLRVNDETRLLQYSQFENDVATLMAGDLIMDAEISFGSYNQEQSMLGINFDNMPEIYLQVPQEDLTEFSQPGKLLFENSVYGVTEDDKFELLYTEVINTETGKRYVFNNLEKKSLNYLAQEDYFVPLELIQQSSMEEVKLQEIKQEVVTAAQEASLISEHTHIDVRTKVESSTNADGEKIMNYVVEFHYDVEPEFSAQDDFGAGKYVISQSQSATAMLKIVQNAFEKEFKQYIRSGKKVIIQVTGSADAAPIARKIPYKGEYGSHEEALVYQKGELNTLTVTPATGITTNEQLAFLRAMGVKDYVQHNVQGLNDMNTEYESHVNVSSERGTQFRRIGVKFTFVDAF